MPSTHATIPPRCSGSGFGHTSSPWKDDSGTALDNTLFDILDLLCQAPRTVEDLAREARLSVANASQHLRILRGAGLVDSEKEGVFVKYRLADPAVCDFFRALRTLAENRLAEVAAIVRQFEYCARHAILNTQSTSS